MLLGDASHACPPSKIAGTKNAGRNKPPALDDTASASPKSKTNSFNADLDVLHATATALIDAMREILLSSDFENAMKVLTSWVPVKDEDLLMRVVGAEWKARKKRAGMKG
jgi:hypothetical protein